MVSFLRSNSRIIASAVGESTSLMIIEHSSSAKRNRWMIILINLSLRYVESERILCTRTVERAKNHGRRKARRKSAIAERLHADIKFDLIIIICTRTRLENIHWVTKNN